MKNRRPYQPRHATSRRVRLTIVPVAIAVFAAFNTSTMGFTSAHATAQDSAGTAKVGVALSAAGASGEEVTSPLIKSSPAAAKAAAPKPEPTKTEPPKPPSAKALKVDLQLQPNYYYCGPASTRIALSASGVSLSQDDLATRLHTTTNGTNSAEDVTRVLNEALGKDLYKTTSIPGPQATPAQMDQLQADIVRAISDGRAAVANIAGGATDAVGVWHNFPGGHYIAVVGYRDDGRTVQIADPSGVFGPPTYWITTINLANWMASRGYSS